MANGKWQVRFDKGKAYSYNDINIKWLKDPVAFNPAKSVVYQNKLPLTGADKIFDFGEYIRIFFVTGHKKVYHRKEL